MRRPQFIHERADWPGFTWDDRGIVAPLAGVRHKQGLLLGRMRGLGFDLRAEANLAALTSEVVKSSAIEGEALSADEVRSSIARRLGLEVAGLPTASRHVDGVVEMMLDATRNCEAPLASERLFSWHAALFPTGRNGLDRITVGAWRTDESGPMQVVSGPLEREVVHFEAPPAQRLGVEMEAFFDWFNSPSSTDSVLQAGVAHLWFVTVHPFDDGNGRIARAIAELMLARADGAPERFYSMSSQLEAERKDYYAALESAQRGALDITEWLLWFLGCLDRALGSAELMLAGVLRKARLWERINRRPVNERQRSVINRMLGEFEGFMSTSKYAKLAKCSQDTAHRDVLELVARGILVKNDAGGRSTSYRLGEAEQVAP